MKLGEKGRKVLSAIPLRCFPLPILAKQYSGLSVSAYIESISRNSSMDGLDIHIEPSRNFVFPIRWPLKRSGEADVARQTSFMVTSLLSSPILRFRFEVFLDALIGYDRKR